MKLRNILLLALALIVVTGLTGCSSIAENAAEKAIEESTGVKVDKDGESIKIQTKDGEAELSSGESKVPDGFPEGLVYKGGTIGLTTKSSAEGKTNFTVTFETKDKAERVAEFYKEAIPDSGYEIDATTEVSGIHIMSFKKGEEVGQASISTDSDGKTLVNIMLQK